MQEETSEAAELVDKAEVSNGQAIVTYSRTEAALADLREKYKGATYDLTTTAGDRAARSARLALTTLRTDLEKKRKELKAPAIAFGKKIDSEAERITAEIVALETPIDAQIKADEKRREDERRAKEEAEAARKKVHTDGIAKLAGYVALAADLGSDRIAVGITFLEGLDLSGFEEYTTEATETRDRSLAGLRTLHVKAKAREDEAARLQAERAEQARVAAEQAETARQLKAQQDELERQRAELRAAQEAAQRQQQEREAAERRQREQQEVLARQQAQAQEDAARSDAQIQQQAVARLLPELPPLAGPVAAPAANVHPMPTRAPAAPASAPTLKLGEIKGRLAPLEISADGLRILGFPFVATEGAAKLWHEHQFPAICDAVIAHAARAKLKQLEAA